MLLIIHKKAYQDFLNLLLKLENKTQNSAVTVDKAENKVIWQDLKQLFQTRILALTDEDLNREVADRWVSLQTEIQREFRLLNTDWLFLISSRQANTKEVRKKALLDRLHKLIKYCELVLSILK